MSPALPGQYNPGFGDQKARTRCRQVSRGIEWAGGRDRKGTIRYAVILQKGNKNIQCNGIHWKSPPQKALCIGVEGPRGQGFGWDRTKGKRNEDFELPRKGWNDNDGRRLPVQEDFTPDQRRPVRGMVKEFLS
jgi:hypothetical protein